MIGIEIITKSLFEVPYLKIRRERTFVIGERFTLEARIKNMGTSIFPGGDFTIKIPWRLNMEVVWGFKIGTLAPNEVVRRIYGTTHVLGPFPTLVLAIGKDARNRTIDFCDMKGNSLKPQKSGFVHVHTIFPKNAEELYQFWALAIAVVSLSLLVLVDVILPLMMRLISS